MEDAHEAEVPTTVMVRMDADVHRRLKVEAAKRGLTLSGMVRGLLNDLEGTKEGDRG